jgi:hypothetical protein
MHSIPLLGRSILILFSHLRLGLPSKLLPSGFPTKILYAVLLYLHASYMPKVAAASTENEEPTICHMYL